MKIPIRRYSKNRGFTVIELLTTIAIVGILIGLLVPALGLVRKTAYQIKQKAQFHTIGIGLEGYQSDFGDYPPSNFVSSDGYCGAQKLAEAMVGWDGFGVHPKTEFMSDGMALVDVDSTPELIYDVVNGITGSAGVFTQSPEENRTARKGPYLELESANAVKLDDLYVDPDAAFSIIDADSADTFVLADMFGKVTHLTTKKKTGMPILYYKANTSGIDHESPTTTLNPSLNNVYDILDNSQIYKAPTPFPGNEAHPLADPLQEDIFYDRAANPNFPGPPRRPYRSESYILHSAGPDGLYGSADDVYNFDTEQSGM